MFLQDQIVSYYSDPKNAPKTIQRILTSIISITTFSIWLFKSLLKITTIYKDRQVTG